jgi:hypothetical protein
MSRYCDDSKRYLGSPLTHRVTCTNQHDGCRTGVEGTGLKKQCQEAVVVDFMAAGDASQDEVDQWVSLYHILHTHIEGLTHLELL